MVDILEEEIHKILNSIITGPSILSSVLVLSSSFTLCSLSMADCCVAIKRISRHGHFCQPVAAVQHIAPG